MNYVSPLIEWAAEMLSESWGTPNLAIPAHMRAPCMALIGLPPCDKYVVPPVGEWNRQLMNDLRDKYNVYIFTPSFGGKIWCRISCQVYNAEEDYYRLRNAVKDLMGVNPATPAKRIQHECKQEGKPDGEFSDREDKGSQDNSMENGENSDSSSKRSDKVNIEAECKQNDIRSHKDSESTIQMADGVSACSEADAGSQRAKSESNARSSAKQKMSNDHDNTSMDDSTSLNAESGVMKLVCCSP